MFRGAELEHFVANWEGYCAFLLFTNHQSVRNWAGRRVGKLPTLPDDAILEEQGEVGPGYDDSDDDNDDEPYVEKDVEFSELEEAPTSKGLHGPAWWSPSQNLSSNSDESGGSGNGNRNSDNNGYGNDASGPADSNSVAVSWEEDQLSRLPQQRKLSN